MLKMNHDIFTKLRRKDYNSKTIISHALQINIYRRIFGDEWCVTMYPDRRSLYLDLWNAQVAAHAACDGDHMCLVNVWVNKEKIVGMLEDLVS